MSIEDRAAERAQCTFNTRELTNYLDGGAEETAKMEKIMLQFERNPLFAHNDEFKKDWEDKRASTIAKIASFVGYLADDGEDDFAKRLGVVAIIDGATTTRLGVHYGLFLSTVRALGSNEQFQHWAITKGAAKCEKFYGSFSMTELEHGSNVAGLQTTATFDEDNDEFVINTPNLGATKWWIGGAAHSATHTVVYARLIVKGKDYGVKNFIVQLRDINTHNLLKGISIGDIGKKMGRDGIDNGWIQFTDVRIPRFNMLSKYTQVDEEGNVTQPKFDKVGYTALVIGRVSMVRDSYSVGKRFITIGLRYATSRRQFGSDPKAPNLEKKIIDYPHHRRRLMPLLATVYALNASAIEVTNFNKKVQLQAQEGAAMEDVVPNMKDLFSLSAGMKAFASWETCKIIDETRQSCGGHGYSAYNGFAQGYADWVVQCTWEGDNNVLGLSCGRAVIQNYLAILKGGKVGVYSAFLTNEHKGFKLAASDLGDAEKLITAWELVTKKVVEKGTSVFQKFEAASSTDEAFEKISSHRFTIGKVYTHCMFLKTFHSRVTKEATPGIRPVLDQLVLLYATHITNQFLAEFYQAGVLADASTFSDDLNFKIDELNEALRPNIIGLTDAFNLSDFFINSQIGTYRGDIYENYFKYVNEQMNDKKKPFYYDSLYRPFLHRGTEPNDNEEPPSADDE